AARVGDHVGDDHRALGRDDVVGLGGGGAVGAFDQDARADQVGIVPGDLAFQGGRDQDFGLERPEFLGAERLRVGGACHAAVFAHMVEQGQDVQAVGVVDDARVVVHRDDLGPGFVEQARGGAAHVAEALDGDACALDVDAGFARRLAGRHVHAAAGGFDAPPAAAQRARLAGHHAGGGGAFVHGIGVHHPGHDLAVGVHVRRGDVLVGPDDVMDFAGVAARDAFQFALGVLARVDADAALGAAEGQVHCRGLD